MGEQTPEVRFEPCTVWEAGPDPATGSCLSCGWLEEDHWMAELARRAAAEIVTAGAP
ncbi:MAG TPA: hypothetical protein VHL53_17815 [Acidimicrobiia bacterium]|nr:hypothetical protein [Acidimicrobiia bacterium]